jgi:transposase-like protein
MPRAIQVWPEDRIQRLVALWSDPTKSLEAIAHEFGVDRETVERQAKRHGLSGRPLRRGEHWPCEAEPGLPWAYRYSAVCPPSGHGSSSRRACATERVVVGKRDG